MATYDPRLGQPDPNAQMIYTVQLPDGRTVEIEGPKGATEADLHRALGLEDIETLTGGMVRSPDARGRPNTGVDALGVGALRGVEEFGTGLAQFLARSGPQAIPLRQAGVTDALDNFARERAAAYNDTAAARSAAGDIGRFGGGVVASIPTMPLAIPAKGASFGSAILRAGTAGAFGATVATPAVTDDYWGEKAPQAAMGAAIGGGILGAGRGAARVGEEIVNLPRRAVNYAGARANMTPIAAEGEALAQRTGIPLTPGMVSGGRAQTFAENMARQSIFTADKAMEADARVAQNALDYLRRIGNRMTESPASAELVGVQMQGVVRDAVRRTATRREEVAARQYGAIHEALGGRAVVDYARTREVLEDIANGSGGSLSGDRMRAAEQARELLARLMRNSGRPGTGMAVPGDPRLAQMPPRTLREAISDRSFWGRAARGDGNVFNDVSPPANRAFARRLFGAIQDDIRAAAERLDGVRSAGPGIVPNDPDRILPPGVSLGEALREADLNYRRYSESIAALEASPMARLLGDDISVGEFMQFNTVPPEAAVRKLSGMTPSELRMVRNFMAENAPDTWQQYKRLILDDAIEAASTLPASAGVRQIPINPVQFINAIGGAKPQGLARLRAVMDDGEMREINDALQAMRRMGDKFGFNFSGTDPRREARSVIEAVKSGSGTAVASTAGEISGLQSVARLMLNADGRRALIELSRLPPNARRAPALAGYIAAIAAGQQMAYPEDSGGESGQ